MKQKQRKEIFSKSTDELKALVKEAKKTLGQMKLDLAQFKLKNTRSVFNKRKEIALIQTALRGKELANE